MFIPFFCENVLILQVIVNVLLKRTFDVSECNRQIIRVWDIKRLLKNEKSWIFFEKPCFYSK